MRRHELTHLPPDLPDSSTNAGLWLQRYLQFYTSDKAAENFEPPLQPADYAHHPDDIPKNNPQAIRTHFASVCSLGESPDHDLFFQRWKKSLTKLPDVIWGEAEVKGRMLVGLGTASVTEAAVTLHHTYGMPFIPGSALKGLAAHYADRLPGWQRGSKAHEIVFGTTTSAGYVTFFDALYQPHSGHGGQPLWPDILTPHHQDYTNDSHAPTDSDSPVPVALLSATGCYLVALAGPTAWAEAAFELLQHALREDGIGAKTSSGYGRLHLERTFSEDQKFAADLLKRVEQLHPRDVNNRASGYADDWQKLDSPAPLKLQIAKLLLQKIDDASRTRAFREKPWFQALTQFVAEHDKG